MSKQRAASQWLISLVMSWLIHQMIRRVQSREMPLILLRIYLTAVLGSLQQWCESSNCRNSLGSYLTLRRMSFQSCTQCQKGKRINYSPCCRILSLVLGEFISCYIAFSRKYACFLSNKHLKACNRLSIICIPKVQIIWVLQGLFLASQDSRCLSRRQRILKLFLRAFSNWTSFCLSDLTMLSSRGIHWLYQAQTQLFPSTMNRTIFHIDFTPRQMRVGCQVLMMACRRRGSRDLASRIEVTLPCQQLNQKAEAMARTKLNRPTAQLILATRQKDYSMILIIFQPLGIALYAIILSIFLQSPNRMGVSCALTTASKMFYKIKFLSSQGMMSLGLLLWNCGHRLQICRPRFASAACFIFSQVVFQGSATMRMRRGVQPGRRHCSWMNWVDFRITSL